MSAQQHSPLSISNFPASDFDDHSHDMPGEYGVTAFSATASGGKVVGSKEVTYACFVTFEPANPQAKPMATGICITTNQFPKLRDTDFEQAKRMVLLQVAIEHAAFEAYFKGTRCRYEFMRFKQHILRSPMVMPESPIEALKQLEIHGPWSKM